MTNLSVIKGLQGANVSLGKVDSAGEVKLTLNWSLHWMLPSVQGSNSGFKRFEDLELEVNFLEIEPWYVQGQPCLSLNELFQSPASAKASRLVWKKSGKPASCFLYLSLPVSVAPKMPEHFIMGWGTGELVINTDLSGKAPLRSPLWMAEETLNEFVFFSW